MYSVPEKCDIRVTKPKKPRFKTEAERAENREALAEMSLLQKLGNVCPNCRHHFRINARQRISIICDADSFVEHDKDMVSDKGLDFPGYQKKLSQAELESAEKEGVIITTDNDPQMILDGEQKFSSLRFYMESTVYPGEMVIYYTEKGDAGFSVQKRLWIVPDSQMNWYIVKTPMKSVTSLRIDPTMYAGNILEFGDFIFNEEKSLGEYFTVSYGDIFNLVIYTGIISSVLKFLQEILKKQID